MTTTTTNDEDDASTIRSHSLISDYQSFIWFCMQLISYKFNCYLNNQPVVTWFSFRRCFACRFEFMLWRSDCNNERDHANMILGMFARGGNLAVILFRFGVRLTFERRLCNEANSSLMTFFEVSGGSLAIALTGTSQRQQSTEQWKCTQLWIETAIKKSNWIGIRAECDFDGKPSNIARLRLPALTGLDLPRKWPKVAAINFAFHFNPFLWRFASNCFISKTKTKEEKFNETFIIHSFICLLKMFIRKLSVYVLFSFFFILNFISFLLLLFRFAINN